MLIPEELQNAIAQLTEGIHTAQLAKATETLSERYRAEGKRFATYMASQEERLAYAAYRMPATYCVNRRVLEELSLRHPEASFESCLDLGAGPGTAMWAASQCYPSINKYTLIEQDEELIKIGKTLAGHANSQAVRQAEWIAGNLDQTKSFPVHELVILSYAIGELASEQQIPLIELAWQAASKALIVIEPGTPPGFERIRAVRDRLIRLGAYILAPCPHARACPMSGGDWCHFSQRVPRSALHKMAKGAELGYEDEKYSYVIAEKPPTGQQVSGRILRHPQKHSGHMELIVCAEEGLLKVKLSRRHGEVYKKARKLEWGDGLLDLKDTKDS